MAGTQGLDAQLLRELISALGASVVHANSNISQLSRFLNYTLRIIFLVVAQ